jgi:threonine aldolase
MFKALLVMMCTNKTQQLLNLKQSCSDVWYGGGLFFPSGTMANQTAIKLHTPGEQLIADKYAHVYHYEGGGASFNSGVLLDGTRGMITANKWRDN